MRVIVTRPAAQAADWVARLRARAIDAVALPLIGIEPLADAAPLRAAWRTLAARRLVVFVSPNAAEQFFGRRPAGADWPEGVLAGSPGPGTTQVLVGLGVPAASVVEPADDAPQFDSESLWRRLERCDWNGAEVLIVRGDGGREWLADALRAAGGRVEMLAVYRRTPPVPGMAESAILRAAIDRPEAHLWFFSSSEAVDHLDRLLRPAAVDWRRAAALATHPRIVERVRQLGFARVAEARPSLDAVVACLQSIGP